MKLRIASFWSAPEEAESFQPTHLVTVRDPGAYALPKTSVPAENTLILEFHDIETPEAGKRPPSEDDIRAVIEFGRGLKLGDRVLVSCTAGISRSPAVAAILMAYDTAPVSKAVHALQDTYPNVRPNALVISLGKSLLPEISPHPFKAPQFP